MPTELASHHHAHGPANRGRRVLRTAAPLFVRFPRSRPHAAVVVLHDSYGLTEAIEDCCRALARSGYVAVAPYLYYETGGKEYRPEHQETAQAAMSLLAADDLAADIAGALDHLDTRMGIPARATAVLGVGMGGHLATWAAAEHELAAAVAHAPIDAPWRGVPDLAHALAGLRTPWLGLTGPEQAPIDAAGELAEVVVVSPQPELGWQDEAIRFIDARMPWPRSAR